MSTSPESSRAGPRGPQEIGFNVDEVKISAQSDLDFLAALAMPDDATLTFPQFYHHFFTIITTSLHAIRDFSKYALGLPRGHAKTMVVKLMVLYTIFFTQRKFILIIGASEERAENILADVCDILDSPNIQSVWGNWRFSLETDRKNFKKTIFCGRNIILASAGQGTAIRGFNVKNSRPDFIICDDAQTADNASSVADSLRFQKWFLGTLMKAKAPTGCTYLYVGNMYPDLEIRKGLYACMLRNLQFSPNWTSMIVGGLLADGSALWEELQPREQLEREFEDDLQMGSPEVFFAEVLNDPQASSSQNIDTNKIGIKRLVPGELHQGNFIIIDPSNDKRKSDESAIGYYEVFDGQASLRELRNEKLSPQQTIYYVLEMCIQKQCPVVFSEANAYQYSLLSWFKFICDQQKIEGITFEPLYNHGISKNRRILDMFKRLMKQELTVSEEVRSRVVLQAAKFNPLVTNNQDDILDILAMSDQVMSNFRHLLQIGGLEGMVIDAEFQSVPSVDESATSSF